MTAFARWTRWGLVAFLLWQGALAAVGLVAEASSSIPRLASTPLRIDGLERIRRALAKSERDADLREGRQWALYQALLEHVPVAGEVHFVTPREVPGIQAFSNLKVLTYPRRFQAYRELPANWQTVLKPVPDLFVLEYLVPWTESLPFAFDRVAEGSDFRLWRCRFGE